MELLLIVLHTYCSAFISIKDGRVPSATFCQPAECNAAGTRPSLISIISRLGLPLSSSLLLEYSRASILSGTGVLDEYRK